MEKEERVSQSITMAKRLMDKVDALAYKTHRSRSHMIDKIVEEYFDGKEIQREE